MGDADLVIVGRVRNAHGIRGELVVEAVTDRPEAVFASGRRVLRGSLDGDAEAGAPTLTVEQIRPFKDGWLISFAELADRDQAERWRDRYLLARREELAPPVDDEVYQHELLGMLVRHVGGESIGTVHALYELPQGLMLDVERAEGRSNVMLAYRPEMVARVDVGERVIWVDPPEGLLA